MGNNIPSDHPTWFDRLTTRRHSTSMSYGMAAAAVACAFILTLAVDLLANSHFGIIYLLGVVSIALAAGFGPALLVIGLSVLPYLFGDANNFGQLPPNARDTIVRFSVFTIAGVLIASVGAAAREGTMRLAEAHLAASRARRSAEEAREQAMGEAAKSAEAAARAEGMAHNVSEALSGREAAWAQLDAVFRTAPVGIAFLDKDLQYVRINDRLADLHGVPAAAHPGRHIRDIAPGVAKAMERLMHRVIETGEPLLDLEFQMGVGAEESATRWFWASCYPILDSSGRVELVAKIVQEITERKRAEAALRHSETRYRALLEANTSIVWTSDPAGSFIAPQPRWESYTGQNWESHRGLGWSKAVHPEDRERLLETWRLSLSGKIAYMNEGRLWHQESGTWRRFQVRAIPILRDDGSIREWVGMVTDIEDQRRAEDDMRQGQKMQAIGKLAGGVAHEVNNQVTGVLGFAEFLGRQLPEGSSQAEDLQQVIRGADRIATVTRQLLAFSRQQVLQPKPIDLNALVKDMEPLLARLIAKDVAIETRLAPEIGAVEADRHQLEQVLLNMALNARDAMTPGGTITITTDNTELDRNYAVTHPGEGVRPGRYVVLTMADTGRGMTPEIRARAFDPFFTTKPPGEGTGLGLSTVYGIVRQSGGFVEVDSEPGEGTTFRIFLPRGSDADIAQPDPHDTPSDGEGVLVVDDEEVVCRYAERVLQEHGYEVHVAPDAGEALAIIAGPAGERIRLVLTDVVMPGMGGQELGRIIAERRPDIGMLYMSGFNSDHAVQRELLSAGLPLIAKPFTADHLLALVREMLSAGALES